LATALDAEFFFPASCEFPREFECPRSAVAFFGTLCPFTLFFAPFPFASSSESESASSSVVAPFLPSRRALRSAFCFLRACSAYHSFG